MKLPALLLRHQTFKPPKVPLWIAIHFTPEGWAFLLVQCNYAQLGFADLSGTIWSNSLILKLQSGRGEAKIIDSKTERVQISVEWLEGKSHLDPFVTEMYVGWRVA